MPSAYPDKWLRKIRNRLRVKNFDDLFRVPHPARFPESRSFPSKFAPGLAEISLRKSQSVPSIPVGTLALANRKTPVFR